MTLTKWQKPYKGPFRRLEAIKIASELRGVANPDINGIYDARVRVRNYEKGQYDVFIKVTKHYDKPV